MDLSLDFEKPIVALEKKLADLKDLSKQEGVDFADEIAILEKKVAKLIDETFKNLTPWQRVQLSRHPNRPYARDYIDALFSDFKELHGDRAHGDDQALLGGVATYHDQPILILGHQKGRSTKQKMERNFGMAKPEGYRKAMRLMELAHRSKMPILTFIDTPGAFPGADAEERGQSQAIAESIRIMFDVEVPILSVVIGEGGSGGALAIGVGNTVLMQEYSIYSVISPESCASILWSNSALAENASTRLKMGPDALLKMGVVDGIVPEPKGGAHRDWAEAFKLMQEELDRHFKPLLKKPPKGAVKSFAQARLEKFRAMGEFAIQREK